MEWNIRETSLKCAECEKAFAEGENIHSLLFYEDEEGFVRRDFCQDCVDRAEKDKAFSRWLTVMPKREQPMNRRVRTDIVLDFFHRLEGEEDRKKLCFRYVLALMLMRKKLLRYGGVNRGDGGEELILSDSRSDAEYRVYDPNLGAEEISYLTQEIGQLLNINLENSDEQSQPQAESNGTENNLKQNNTTQTAGKDRETMAENERKLKLAVFTDEVSQDFARALEVAKEYKLDGLEIRSVWNKQPFALTADDIKEMKKIIGDSGMKVCSIAGPFYKCEMDSAEERAKHLDILKKCIEVGKEFDCSIIRGFTFWRRDKKLEEVWSGILEGFEEPVKICEAGDAYIGIENEYSTYIGTGTDLKRFLDELGSDRIKAVWDPANSLADPLGDEVPFPEGYEAIKDDIIHVHIKDGSNASGKFEHAPVGDGEIDYKGHFAALIKDGYQGYCSLETHWRAKKMEGVDIDRPGGEEFSKTGEYASRICLDNIKRILSEL